MRVHKDTATPISSRGEQLPDERIISFEGLADVMKVITAARLALFRTVKEMPGENVP